MEGFLMRRILPPSSRFLRRRDHRLSPLAQEPLAVEAPEQEEGQRRQSRPAGLVARAEPRPRVAVEVLVEEDEVAPVGIAPVALDAAVQRAGAAGVAREEP